MAQNLDSAGAGWTCAQTFAFYEAFADSYDDFPDAEYPAPKIAAGWLEHLDSCRILDVGCGTGLSSRLLLEKHRVTGIDASPQMLQRAQKLPFAHLLVRDIGQPFALPEKFNAAICVGVFDFVQNPIALLREIYSNLLPNALFAVTFPATPNDSLTSYTSEQVKQLTSDANFKIQLISQIIGYIDSESKETVYFWAVLLERSE